MNLIHDLNCWICDVYGNYEISRTYQGLHVNKLLSTLRTLIDEPKLIAIAEEIKFP